MARSDKKFTTEGQLRRLAEWVQAYCRVPTAADIGAGLAMVFGLDENTVSTVAGAVVSVSSVVTYILAEGKVDAVGAVQNGNG